MVLPDCTAKGIKLVLQERGINVTGLNAEKMHGILSEFKDFSSQMISRVYNREGEYPTSLWYSITALEAGL